MKHPGSALARVGAALLLAVSAACSDQQPAASRAAPGDASTPSYNVKGRSPRDVPEVRIDLPARARPWDDDPAALAEAVAKGEGYAVVAFKEPGSGRALATGRRAAVTAGTVRAGLQLLERNGAEILDLLDAIGGARVRISPEAAAKVAAHPLVDFVEPRQYGRAEAQTVPAGVSLVKAPDFWAATNVRGAGAKVEIIDTGWQPGHPDLPAVPPGNCSGAFGGCTDSDGANWHGTAVFGVIAARDNADGVVGVAPGLTASDVYIYGACDSSTSACPTDHVTAGINAGIWNVHVMNLSLVQPFDAGQAVAVGQAWNDGIVIVAAAGNNLTNTLTYPANYANVIGVSGVKGDKTFASTSSCTNYSNQGAHVDLAAPFEANTTTGPSTYGTHCGTSMAAAYVSGVAALLKSQNPSWTNQQIVDTLFARAEDLGQVGKDPQFGHGLVRPHRPVPPVSAAVGGTGSVVTAGTYTWTASAAGGTGAYTYKWEYRPQGSATWTQVGTASSYSRTLAMGNPSFELRLTVTSGGVSASATHAVAVAIAPPLSVSISGPSYGYPGGKAVYSAVVSGGNGSYGYTWSVHYHGGLSGVDDVYAQTINYTIGQYAPDHKITVTVYSGGQSVTAEKWIDVL